MQVATVTTWLQDLKTEEGRQIFLTNGIHEAILLLRSAVTESKGSDVLVPLMRLLRNSILYGETAVSAIVQHDVVDVVVDLVRSFHPASVSSQLNEDNGNALMTACAQFVANVASSGPAGAEAVWSKCYPTAFRQLLEHPLGNLRNPVALALYACCRQCARRSQALCGIVDRGDCAPTPSAIGTSSDAGGSQERPSASPCHLGCSSGADAYTEQVAANGAVRSGTAVVCVSHADQDAAAVIWQRLLAALPRAADAERILGAADGPEWTALLASCVALRQGLLRPLLRLLSPVSKGSRDRAPAAGVGSGTLPAAGLGSETLPAVGVGSGTLPAAAAAATAAAAAPPPEAHMKDQGTREAPARRDWVGVGQGESVSNAGGPAAAVLPATGAGAAAAASAQESAVAPPTAETLSAADGYASACGGLCPVLLHLLASELYELKGSVAVDLCPALVEVRPAELDRQDANRGLQVMPNPLAPPAATAPLRGLTEPTPPEPRPYGAQAPTELAVGGPGAGGVTEAAGGEMGCEAPAGGGAAPSGGCPVSPKLLAELPLVARPLAASMQCVMEVAESAARWLAAGASVRDTMVASTPREEGAAGAAVRKGMAAGAHREEGAAAASDWDPVAVDLEAPPESVLEACMEVLKAAAQREDGCRAISGGVDLAEWLLCRAGLAVRLLGMLAALQPANSAREKRRREARAGAAAGAGRGAGAGTSADVSAGVAASVGAGAGTGVSIERDRIVVELPMALCILASSFPRQVPYVGFRGDLVAVLANGAFRRPRVASELVAAGGLELLLSQTHLDVDSPLAREWALWGVRNMCESSEEAQQRIMSLEPQTVVETPELRQLGLRLQLDKETGKLKVSKTDEAMRGLSIRRESS